MLNKKLEEILDVIDGLKLSEGFQSNNPRNKFRLSGYELAKLDAKSAINKLFKGEK